MLSRYGSNSYIVGASEEATEVAVVDPGGDPAPLLEELERLGATVAGILVTHTDVDHVDGVAALAEATGAEVWAPAGEAERAPARGRRAAATRRSAARPRARGARRRHRRRSPGSSFEVVGVPGHSVDHVAFCGDGTDLLRRPALRGLGRPRRLRTAATGRRSSPRSSACVDRYGPDAVVYPGHGEPTTLGRELDDEPVPRRAPSALMAEQFQAPRGTHDVLPADAPLVARRARRWRSRRQLYGWRRIQTPGFEDTALFARTAGEASDVVHKEMYTFTDRSDRSLTLRPEGTAPIARAYVEHGLHREPQPVKALHDRADVPLRRAAAAAATASTGSSRSRRSARPGPTIDAEVIEFYVELLGRLGVTRVGAPAQLDRRRELPARVRRAAERVARRPRRRARRGRAPQARDEPAAGLRRQEPRRCARRSRTRRRSASRSATPAASTSRASGGSSTCSASRTCSTRRSCAGSTTTRARPSSSSGPRRTPTRRSAAAAATTGSSRRSAGRRRPGSASAPGIERLLLAIEREGVELPSRSRSTSSSSSTAAPRDEVLPDA